MAERMTKNDDTTTVKLSREDGVGGWREVETTVCSNRIYHNHPQLSKLYTH